MQANKAGSLSAKPIRHLLLGVFFFVVCSCATIETPNTQWSVSSAAGLDAVMFIGPLSGDPLAASTEFYSEDVEFFRTKMSDESLAALEFLDTVIRGQFKVIVTSTLALFFSGGPTASLTDVINSAENPELLRPAYETSIYWNAAHWNAFLAIAPQVAVILKDLDRLRFETYWRERHLPSLIEKTSLLSAQLPSYDVIGGASFYMDRIYGRNINVLVSKYAAPLGIRVLGQRFVTHPSYTLQTVINDAAHEMFHPPYDENNPELWARLENLRDDPWMKNIVEKSNPVYGYVGFEAIVNEDSTKALDQLVAERLGVAQNMGARLRRNDEGMHMLAAALYHAMKEDGFADSGGDYEAWLFSALDRDLLTPESVRARAAIVVGEEAVARWD